MERATDPWPVWVDGRWCAPDEPVARADDAGLLYGHGAFETVRLYRGRPVALTRHLDRLSTTLEALGIDAELVGLGAAVARGLARSAPSSDLLYLSTTRHPVPEREWVRFSEGQSHATDDHVLRPDPHPAISEAGSALVLVDDETTTGPPSWP